MNHDLSITFNARAIDTAAVRALIASADVPGMSLAYVNVSEASPNEVSYAHAQVAQGLAASVGANAQQPLPTIEPPPAAAPPPRKARVTPAAKEPAAPPKPDEAPPAAATPSAGETTPAAPTPAPAPSPSPASTPSPSETARIAATAKIGANAANRDAVRKLIVGCGDGVDAISKIPADKIDGFIAAVNALPGAAS